MADEKNSKTPISSSNPPRSRPRPITTVCTNTLNKKPLQPFPKGEKR